MNDPLAKHDLYRLEQASADLNSHIRERRRRLRPSTPRRLIGLLFSVPAVFAGVALFYWSIQTGHLLGLPAIIGPVLFAGGGMWIYCDWFE